MVGMQPGIMYQLRLRRGGRFYFQNSSSLVRIYPLRLGDHTLIMYALDDEARVDACNTEHIGGISLMICATTTRKRRGRPSSRTYNKDLPQSQTLHEKSKKGGAHCVRYECLE